MSAPLLTIPAPLLDGGPRRDGLVAGVDGGATKTIAAVLDPSTGALHTASAGPANPSAMSADRTVATLLEALRAALDAAGAHERDVAHAVIAVASAELGIGERVAAASPVEATVVGDVVAAWASVARGAPAIGAIAGTGSNVLGVGPGGRTWRTGGWGHLLGDEGSAWWIARGALAAVLRERDGSGPPTALTQAARRFFDVDDAADVQRPVYAEPFSKSQIAAFAPHVSSAADEGDAIAHALLERAGHDLAEQIATVAARTGLAEPRVGTIGGTWNAARVRNACEQRLRELVPGAHLTTPAVAPWGGALALAARAAGHDPEVVSGS